MIALCVKKVVLLLSFQSECLFFLAWLHLLEHPVHWREVESAASSCSWSRAKHSVFLPLSMTSSTEFVDAFCQIEFLLIPSILVFYKEWTSLLLSSKFFLNFWLDPYQTCDLQICLPFCGLSFQTFDSVLCFLLF